jgi:multidrug efflux pump subunit AcrA (membrane-fusion protein)
MEHHVPEEGCILCKKDLAKALAAKEPERHRKPGEDVRFAQVASAEALAKSGIRVEPVVFAAVAPRMRISGETIYQPESVTRITSRCAGVLRQVLVQVGSTVSAKTVVAVVDATEVGRAKSAFMQAVASRVAAQAVAKRVRASAEAGIRSAAELQEVDARLRSAEIGVFDAEQALRNLGFHIDQEALAKLEPAALAERLRRLGLPDGFDDDGSANLLPVLAPRAGSVTDIRAVAGESVEANGPLLVVADTSTLWLSLPVPINRAGQVATGQTVTFVASGGQEASGTVAAIAQSADQQTRLVTVWARLANPDQHLRVGLFGMATITIGTPVTAATVPTGAIQFDGAQAYVFVQRTESIFRSLPVRILARDGGQVSVDRLAEGDAIAVTGTGMLFSASFPERMGAGCTDD